MRGEFLDINGVRLYYYAAGSRGAGEPIVLLHGFPTSGHLWSGVAPLLPAGHRVVVLDLLGFGRSDPPSSHGVDIRAHADRLVAVLDHLGINFACVVGHGVGGGIAQFFSTPNTHLILLWVAAFIGATVGGAFSALVTRSNCGQAPL